MRMELSDIVRYLAIAIVITGLVTFGFGAYLSMPDPSIRYVSEFDHQYAQDNNEDYFRVPFTGQDENLTAESIHTTYDSDDLSNETISVFQSNIESSQSFSVSEGNLTDYRGRFIVTVGDGSQHVYEGQSDGLYPPRIILLGLSSFLIGFMAYTSIRGTENNTPEGIEQSDDSRWEYDFKE